MMLLQFWQSSATKVGLFLSSVGQVFSSAFFKICCLELFTAHLLSSRLSRHPWWRHLQVICIFFFAYFLIYFFWGIFAGFNVFLIVFFALSLSQENFQQVFMIFIDVSLCLFFMGIFFCKISAGLIKVCFLVFELRLLFLSEKCLPVFNHFYLLFVLRNICRF